MNYASLTDSELLAQCRCEDVRAFEVLFARYSHKLRQYALKYLKDDSLAEETMMDIMLWVWNKRHDLELKGEFAPYIFTATKHATLKALRKKAAAICTVSTLEAADVPAGNSTDHDLSYREMETIVQQKLSKLSPQRKRVFEMSRYEHLTHDQISVALNLSIFTVKNHIKASLKYFREHLKAHLE